MDWMKLLFVYGTNTAWLVMLLVALTIFFICRGNRYLLPRGWRGWITFSVAIIFAVPAVAYLHWITPIGSAYPKVNQPAPALSFHVLDNGAEHQLQDYQGKVVLLNVWATWCKGCVQEMPDLTRLQQEYAERGVVVITVSREAPADILKFAGLKSMSSVNGYVDQQESSSPLVTCAIGLPATYIIDSHGVLREAIVGSHDHGFYEEHMRRYLTSPRVESTESSSRQPRG